MSLTDLKQLKHCFKMTWGWPNDVRNVFGVNHTFNIANLTTTFTYFAKAASSVFWGSHLMHANYWPQWYPQLHPSSPPLSCVTLDPITTPRHLHPDIAPFATTSRRTDVTFMPCCCFNEIHQPVHYSLAMFGGPEKKAKANSLFHPSSFGPILRIVMRVCNVPAEGGGRVGKP